MAKKSAKKTARPKDLAVKNATRVKGGYKPPPPPPKKGCWVARTVYGEDDPRWMLFREWLLGDAPAWFRALYLRHGESFARRIESRPMVKTFIRAWMNWVIDCRASAASGVAVRT